MRSEALDLVDDQAEQLPAIRGIERHPRRADRHYRPDGRQRVQVVRHWIEERASCVFSSLQHFDAGPVRRDLGLLAFDDGGDEHPGGPGDDDEQRQRGCIVPTSTRAASRLRRQEPD